MCLAGYGVLYLETAYNQVQEKALAMDNGAEFLSYQSLKQL